MEEDDDDDDDSEEEEQESEEESSKHEVVENEMDAAFALQEGTSSVLTSGNMTPHVVQLRKESTTSEAPPSLYTVIQQSETSTSVDGALYGSSHSYAVPGNEVEDVPVEDESTRKRKGTKQTEGKSKKYKDFKF